MNAWYGLLGFFWYFVMALGTLTYAMGHFMSEGKKNPITRAQFVGLFWPVSIPIMGSWLLLCLVFTNNDNWDDWYP